MTFGLPDPLPILQSPPGYEYWKRMCKSKVIDYWENKLRAEADLLPSLEFFKPSFMSLAKHHIILTFAHSPFEVGKAIVAIKMLSGRYPTDKLSRHWNNQNPEGLCQLPGCHSALGDLPHMLTTCPALADARSKMLSL